MEPLLCSITTLRGVRVLAVSKVDIWSKRKSRTLKTYYPSNTTWFICHVFFDSERTKQLDSAPENTIYLSSFWLVSLQRLSRETVVAKIKFLLLPSRLSYEITATCTFEALAQISIIFNADFGKDFFHRCEW